MQPGFTFGKKTSPGADSAVVLYDDLLLDDAQSVGIGRIVTVAFLDQNFAINVWWAKDKETTSVLRLVQSNSYAGGVAGHVAAVRATQPITVVAVASLANNDRFTVTMTVTRNGVAEKTTTKTFEYKVNGSFTAVAGRHTIDVSALTTDVQVAVATAAKIESVFGSAVVTCAVPSTATLTVTSTVSGLAYALTGTETVANAGFSIGTPTAGVDGSVVLHDTIRYPGRTKVVLDTGTVPAEFDVRVDAICTRDAGA